MPKLSSLSDGKAERSRTQVRYLGWLGACRPKNTACRRSAPGRTPRQECLGLRSCHRKRSYIPQANATQAWWVGLIDGSGKSQKLMATAGQYPLRCLSTWAQTGVRFQWHRFYVYYPDRDTLTRITFTRMQSGPHAPTRGIRDGSFRHIDILGAKS
jgi:hypothetical protein